MKIKELKSNTKKLDESKFASIIKEIHSLGELIRARQGEKQAIIDEFNSEDRRFLVGKLSQRTVDSSIKKTRVEIGRLNQEIRDTIKESRKNLKEIDGILSAQSPKRFRISLSGLKEVKGGEK